MGADMYLAMDDFSDRDLWQRARDGDVDAFAELFQRHARTIYNYCFRRTADWSAAEDLTSAVFLEAWKRRDADLAQESARPWLCGVAANLLRNHRRAIRRYRDALDRMPTPGVAADFAGDLADRIDDEARMKLVLAALKRLSAGEQEVVGLCLFAELTYEEAAAVLGVPIGTVRSRLSRARDRLRHLVSPLAPSIVDCEPQRPAFALAREETDD